MRFAAIPLVDLQFQRVFSGGGGGRGKSQAKQFKNSCNLNYHCLRKGPGEEGAGSGFKTGEFPFPPTPLFVYFLLGSISGGYSGEEAHSGGAFCLPKRGGRRAGWLARSSDGACPRKRDLEA